MTVSMVQRVAAPGGSVMGNAQRLRLFSHPSYWRLTCFRRLGRVLSAA
jgi:hypothetical protein